MGNLFSRKKVSKVTQQDRAVLQLKKQRDDLIVYQKRLNSTIEKDRQIAKKLISEQKKERALLLLRKKRYLEKLMENAEKQLDQLERLTHDIEFAQIETKVVDGLKVGNLALKQLNEILNLENIELLMDETKEAIDKQNEINELLGQRSEIFGLEISDDESLEDELNDLISQQLPNVPDNDLLPITKDEVKSKPIEQKVKKVVLTTE